MSIFEKVKELCNSRGITIPQLEKSLGFGNRAIYKWQTTSPSIEKIMAVANFFNISVDELIGRSQTQSDEEIEKGLLLQRAFDERPEMRMLFSVAEDATAEDIQKAIDIIKIMKGSNNG